MKRIICLITSLLIAFSAVPAAFVRAAGVSASITVSEDSYTEAGNPDSPVGALGASTIITSSTGGSKPAAENRDVYLKFDLRSHELTELSSARLRLFINSVANKADRTLTVWPVKSDWNERELTWNNAPEPMSDSPIAAYRQIYDKNNHADIWISIDVTEYIKQHSGEGVISFRISSDTGATKMDSRETLNAPSLEVSFNSAVPTARVTVKCQNEQGQDIARPVILDSVRVGGYSYPNDVAPVISYQGIDYEYDASASTTGIEVTEDGENLIKLVYTDPVKNPQGVEKTVIKVSDDAFAKQNEASTVFNSADPDNLQVTMNMGAAGAAARRDGFVKFDLSGVKRTFITSALLVGYITSATNEGERVISVYPTENSDWSESTLNWNNAPSYSGGEPIAKLSVQSGVTGVWATADITDYCREAGDVISLRMISDTAATSFATKEGDSFNAMALVLRYTDDENYTLASVTVRTVDDEGNEIAPDVTLKDCLVGDYYYNGSPAEVINGEKGVFVYDKTLSTLHINVTADGPNIITLVYRKQGENMGVSVLAESGGWNWCLDPRAVRDADPSGGSDKTYVAYIDNRGNIKATQYDNLSGTYKQVFVRTGFTADDHCNPAVFVLPDHRVMIIYSAHSEEERFYYRISSRPGDISSFGEEKTVSTEGFGTVTYPTPFYMNSQPDGFFLFWRGISWQPTVARLSLPDENDDIDFIMEPKMMIDSRSGESDSNKRPYAKYASDGSDRIYVSYTYDHPDSVAENTLYCSYLDVSDMTLRSVTGELLATVSEAPFRITNSEDKANPLVVDRTEGIRDWNWETGLDANGNPVVLYAGISADSRTHLYYHSRWTGEKWLTTYIDNGGGWFHDNTKGAEKCYSGGLCLDHSNTDTVFASVPVDGIYGRYYEIYKYVLDGKGGVAAKTPVTQNSQQNNFRPYVAVNSEPGDAVYLLWLSGEYYYWSNKKDFLPSNGNVKYGFTNKVNTASVLSGYDWTADLESIDLGNTSHVVSDLAFVSESVNGAKVEWSSSNTDVVRNDGALIRPAAPTNVTVTASLTLSGQKTEKEYFLTVYPKISIGENLVFRYDFDEADLFDSGGQSMISDKSPNGNHARLMGTAGRLSAGSLDLTANERDPHNGNRPNAENSYLLAPDGLLDTLRSYTFMGRIKLKDASMDYRLYDFGSGGTNSVFGRLTSSYQAGVKINDGTTQYVTAEGVSLSPGVWYDVAYTYDAASRVTKLYLNGAPVASGKTIETEAIELPGENTRNYIGRSQWWDTHYDYTARENPDFNGYIDSISLYNAALTDSEILALTTGASVKAEVEVVRTEGAEAEVRVKNGSASALNGVLIVTGETDSGFSALTKPVELAPDEEKIFSLNFTGEAAKGSVKAFLWDSLTKMKPLGEAAG